MLIEYTGEKKKRGGLLRISNKRPIIVGVVILIIIIMIIVGIAIYSSVSSKGPRKVAEFELMSVEQSITGTSWFIMGNIKNIVDEPLNISLIAIKVQGSAVDVIKYFKLSEIAFNGLITSGEKTLLNPGESENFNEHVDAKRMVDGFGGAEVEVLLLYSGEEVDSYSASVDQYYDIV